MDSVLSFAAIFNRERIWTNVKTILIFIWSIFAQNTIFDRGTSGYANLAETASHAGLDQALETANHKSNHFKFLDGLADYSHY